MVDAAACCEAVSRPSMQFVPLKSVPDQAALMTHRARQLLVEQRTRLANAIRGHLAELGIIAQKGQAGFAALLVMIERLEAPHPTAEERLDRRSSMRLNASARTLTSSRQMPVTRDLHAWIEVSGVDARRHLRHPPQRRRDPGARRYDANSASNSTTAPARTNARATPCWARSTSVSGSPAPDDDLHVADEGSLLEDARASDVRYLRGRVSEVRHPAAWPLRRSRSPCSASVSPSSGAPPPRQLGMVAHVAARRASARTAAWRSRCTAARGCSAPPRTRSAPGSGRPGRPTDWSDLDRVAADVSDRSRFSAACRCPDRRPGTRPPRTRPSRRPPRSSTATEGRKEVANSVVRARRTTTAWAGR